eukprot:scaffold189943_cov32-Tisochrysis_lutea.AAC.1
MTHDGRMCQIRSAHTVRTASRASHVQQQALTDLALQRAQEALGGCAVSLGVCVLRSRLLCAQPPPLGRRLCHARAGGCRKGRSALDCARHRSPAT